MDVKKRKDGGITDNRGTVNDAFVLKYIIDSCDNKEREKLLKCLTSNNLDLSKIPVVQREKTVDVCSIVI